MEATNTPSAHATTTQQLDAALLDAHAARDAKRLVTLYAEAGAGALARGDVDAGAFFLTHARVFALEAGDPRERALHAQLRAMGRET